MGLLGCEEQWLYCSQTMESIVFLLCTKNNGVRSVNVLILNGGVEVETYLNERVIA